VRVVDTSLFVEAERRNVQALERIAELLDADALAVAAITVLELLRSPTLPEPWRRFYGALFSVVPVLPVTCASAERAAVAAASLGRDVKAPDALIAGVALEHELPITAADTDFVGLAPDVELLRVS
jgi:predicted nucleic acid-binding protein